MMKRTMAAARRLAHISRILHPKAQLPFSAMRYNMTMSGPPEATSILQSTFSDIESNLLTTEGRCYGFMEHYNRLPKEERLPLLCKIARQYGIDKDSVVSVAHNVIFSKDKGEVGLLTSCDRMRSSLRSKYKTMFVHLGRVTGGVKFLVDLRADVISFRQSATSEVEGALLQEMNSTLKELLLMWFTVGFLNLERITWMSPCDLVQKVSNYEAVHRIKTWEDIKRRVGPYRRCYIFSHNSMPREPVVVLHTALTNEISSSIHSIIQTTRFRPPFSQEETFSEMSSTDTSTSMAASPVTPMSPMPPDSFKSLSSAVVEDVKEDPAQINCAVFYSITSTQRGLQGIEMGNYLIKSVVQKLQAEFPTMVQFSSLSPIPGFREWLLTSVTHSINKRNAGESQGVPLLLPHELELLSPYQAQNHFSALDTFKEHIITHMWCKDLGLQQVMKGPLMRLCAHYLFVQKRRNYALNPVANFHLSNGAELWRINYLADTSIRGLNNSCGLMVNYRYFLEMTDTNSRNYLEKHQIAASDFVKNLLIRNRSSRVS